MIVGVPAEIKTAEDRVALTPDGVRELIAHGHRVRVEGGAGDGSSIGDADFAAAGAEISAWRGPGPPTSWSRSKSRRRGVRPAPPRAHSLHLSASGRLCGCGGRLARGRDDRLGLRDGAARRRHLAPPGADERGGRAHGGTGGGPLPGAPNGGRGVLLGGAPGVRPARIVVLGAGNVGWNSAWIAQGMEAEVLLLDKSLDRLRWVDQIHRAGS